MKVAIITGKTYDNCETFIKAQIDLLPFDKVHYCTKDLPIFYISAGGSAIRKIKNRLIKLRGIYYRSHLIKKLKNENIDVILAQYGTTGAIISPICKKLDIPLIIHFHGHDAVRRPLLKTYKNDYRKMFEYASVIISVSHEMTKRLISIGCKREKVVYNTYGPNDSFLSVKSSNKKKQFIGVGRFVEKKAPDLTIIAFSKVVLKHPSARLVLAGEGNLMNLCKRLAKQYGIVDKIYFPGRVTPKEYQIFLKESIAFVQHSVQAKDGDMEGTPVAILEASGAGLPIISTRHAGIPDVIIHNKTGLLSEERNVEAMAKNMIWILENTEKAKIMGANGKNRIHEFFSMNRHIEGLSQIIKQSVKESK